MPYARIICLVCLQALSWGSVAFASESDISLDATMELIIAADTGHFRGEAHFRSLEPDAAWETSDHEISCIPMEPGKVVCDGKTGETKWSTRQRYSDGVIYVEGDTGGVQWNLEYRVIDAWYVDGDNFGYERTWTSSESDVELEGIDTMIQMGARNTIFRKLREKDSNQNYRFTIFEVSDRVDPPK